MENNAHNNGSRSKRKAKLTGPRFEIPIYSSSYPEQLREIDDAPSMLYVIGDPRCLRSGLAVVGSRNATPYGLSCAEHFSGIAAQHGVTIVSGGARGCDSAAHKGALSLGGKTVAVLGGGCDQIYPAEHASLFQKIIDDGGAIISEHDWSFPPKPYTFRARNRIIAALTKATLIVEAGLPSGTFSTADEALRAGREVLVVPGSIASSNSRGANRLLFQGAIPVVDDDCFYELLSSLFTDDIFQHEWGVSPVQGSCETNSDDALFNDPLIQALMAEPMRPDQIFDFALKHCEQEEASGWAAVRLEEGQDKGLIMRYPDGSYGPSL